MARKLCEIGSLLAELLDYGLRMLGRRIHHRLQLISQGLISFTRITPEPIEMAFII
jgi:hypothetical protein